MTDIDSPSPPRTAAGTAVVRLAAGLAGLAGWRRALVAILLGALAAGALPPVGAVPLLVPAFAGLVWMIDGAGRARRAFWLGWWFGLGFFTAGLYWIAAALMVDIARFWWLVPFAVLGLPMFFGLFSAAATLAVWLIGARGPWRAPALASAWIGAEFLRGHILTGFPWNLVGSAWTEVGPMLQAAAVLGAYGLGWVTVALAALPAALAEPDAGGAWRTGRGAGPALGAGLAALAVIAGLGAWRLAAAPAPDAPDATVPDVRLRLVQPNVEQSLKWRDSERAAIFERLLTLSRAPAAGPPPTTIIWPEAATPFLFERSPEARRAAAAVLPPDGLLLLGTPRITDRAPPADPPYAIWNGLVALDAQDTVLAAYDKFHLVPFGEYVPLRGVLPVAKITPGAVDFSAGPGPRTLRLPGLPPVGPLICYEVIFPGNVIDPADRPDWLLTVTNDGWYGNTSGPYQHFASAAMRAVEQGMPMVRAANTGISGVVDPWGRVTARLGYGRQGVVDAALPRALPTPPPFQAWGGWILAVLVAAGLLPGLAAHRRTLRQAA